MERLGKKDMTYCANDTYLCVPIVEKSIFLFFSYIKAKYIRLPMFI